MPTAKKKGKSSAPSVPTLLGVLVTLLVAGAIYLNQVYESPYMAVRMTDGNTYFGQLHRFPRLRLTDVYVVQTLDGSEEDTSATFQIVPLGSLVFWGSGELELNRSQILFMGRISNASQVMRAIERSKGLFTP